MKNKFFKIFLCSLLCASLLLLAGCSGGSKIADKNGNMLSFSPDDKDLPEGYFIMHDGKYYPVLPEEISKEPVVYQWYTEYDNLIPELTEKDSLVYVSSSAVPSEFKLYEMEDCGNTIGMRFELLDPSKESSEITSGGKTVITIPSQKDKTYCTLSSCEEYIKKEAGSSKLDQKSVRFTEIQGKNFSPTMLSDEGFLKNLTKDGIYRLSFYVGTIYHSVDLKADTHLFVQKNNLVISSVTPMKSMHFQLNLPSSLKNGYYNIDGFGLFKYSGEETIEEKQSDFGGENASAPVIAPVPEETQSAS